MKEKLKFGWAEVSITPEKRPMLAGQFYPRISQYVETPITVTALAIEAGAEQAIFCSVDQTHIYASITNGVRGILARTIPDFDARKLIINATHTHTAFDYADENGIGLDALEEYLGMQSAPVEGLGKDCRSRDRGLEKQGSRRIFDRIRPRRRRNVPPRDLHRRNRKDVGRRDASEFLSS